MAIVGLEAKLYGGTAGTSAATEIDAVKDVTLNMTAGEADVSSRKSRFRKYKTSLLDVSLDFEIIYDASDEMCTSIRSAFMAGTAMALKVTDDNGKGLDGDFMIVGWNCNQPLENGVTVSVSAKLAESTREPSWVTT